MRGEWLSLGKGDGFLVDGGGVGSVLEVSVSIVGGRRVFIVD